MSRPRARTDLRFHPQIEERGLTMVHVSDSPGAAHYALSPLEALLLQEMDGSREAAELAALARERGHFCATGYVEELVGRCRRLGLLAAPGSGAAMAAAARERRRRRPAEFLRRLLFFRIPLLDPWPWLGGPARLWGLLCRRALAWPFAILVLTALYFVLLDLDRAAATGLRFLTPAGLPWLLLTIVAVKVAHEIGHAAAARRHGCPVREAGICFLIFLPCLYVDTSGAWSLPDRRRRLEVAGAGILVELFIGALAAHLWYRTAPGTVNSIAFFLMAVSWVSSLLFNANPLMRFDGYYILSDLAGLPNLAARAGRRLRSLFWHGLLGVAAERAEEDPAGRPRFLAGYGVAALLYRFFLGLAIARALYARFFPALGIALGALVLWQFLLAPLLREGRRLVRHHRALRPRPLPCALAGGAAALLLLGCFLPLSRHRVHPCRLEAAAEQVVAAPVGGALAACHVVQGERVAAGQVLLTFARGEKERDLRLARIELALARLRRDRAEAAGRGEEALYLQPLRQAEDRLRRAREELAALVLRAPRAGLLVAWRDDLDRGARLERGEVLGRLALPGPRRARALLAERELAGAAPGRPVRLVLHCGGRREIPATITTLARDSLRRLDGSPLADRLGGPVPTGRDGEGGLVPLQPHYVLRAELAGAHPELPLGLTGRLLVPAAGRSLAGRLWRLLRRRLYGEGLL